MTTSIQDIVLVALILFGGTLIRSTFGFGDALFAMPLMSLVIGVGSATPVMGLVSLMVAVGALVLSRRHLDMAAIKRLLVGSMVGIPVGVLLLKRVEEQLLRLGLGASVIVFGLYMLSSPRMPELRDRRWAFPFGFLSGCLGGAYNIGGPPIVLYGAMRRWPPARFRATLHGGFLPASIVIALIQGLGGLWTGRVLTLFAFSIPSLGLAMLLGEKLVRRTDPARFERYLSIVLVALGILLIL
ncbi:MAG: sulfite exporter TauE/SafE family protein [Actinobacteria bacterium]|nr:sulfite exporter TauE/SafE family protein [Actinomycetota bacterium]